MAEAVAVLIEKIHQSFPAVAMHPLPPYEDEDFTLEVKLPGNVDRDEAINICIRHALAIEDTFGFAILTRVKQE